MTRAMAETPLDRLAALARTSPVLQARAAAMPDARPVSTPIQRATPPNRTGLPDGLKANIEAMSGFAMDDVRVHRNSPKPAQLQAHAYAQGTEIHLAPGQEKHLPHEAWHVVQQKQGRVRPTMQLRGVGVNDDVGLEREADRASTANHTFRATAASPSKSVQRTRWVVTDVLLENADNPEEIYEGSDAPMLSYGDTWDDVTGDVTHVKDRMNRIFASNRTDVADKDDHKALIRQFEELTAAGGLLMHAVAGGEEVESLGYLIEQGTPLNKIRTSEYPTKLLSYIRSDLTMKTFAFRKFGLLVDWRRIWDVIGYKNDAPTIWPEDQQSSRYALSDAESYAESGGSMGYLGHELDQMALRQNALKKGTGGIANWNEILTYNAVTAGVVGLLWIQDMTALGEPYTSVFTPKMKADLYKSWVAKTRMNVMPIYIYRHQGSPQGANLTDAKARLGKQGASTLELAEAYKENVRSNMQAIRLRHSTERPPITFETSMPDDLDADGCVIHAQSTIKSGWSYLDSILAHLLSGRRADQRKNFGSVSEAPVEVIGA